MEKFTTEKGESRLNLSKWIGLGLLIIGLILLSMKDFSGIRRFQSIGGMIDGIVMPLIGAFLFISSYKGLKKLKGSFISFNEKGFSFKSRLEAYQIDSIEELKDIKVGLKTVEIETVEGKMITFFLDDYSDFKTRKTIKEEFTRLKEIKNNA